MMESKFADVGDIRLNYGEGEPNGPKLVFLNGFPGTWDGADYELLEPHYHVFAPTMRGMGHSQRVDSYPVPPYIEDTGNFIRQVVGAPALGIGYSAGAWFGLGAAVTDGELFSAFVSLDQPLNARDHVKFHEKQATPIKAFTQAARAATSVDELASLLAMAPAPTGAALGELMSEDDLKALASEWSENDPEIFGPWADHGLRAWIVIPELDAWPGAYSNPLMFIDGDPEAGAMTNPSAVQYNLERYPWAERIQMTGLDHGLNLSADPGPVIEEIRRFFDNI